MSQEMIETDPLSDASDADPTSQERYKLALGTLIDGVVWPALRGRRGVAQRLRALHTLRHLRALGEESMLYPMSAALPAQERLELVAEQARHLAMRSRPLLRSILPGMLLEVLREHAPVMGSDARLITAQGLRGPDVDLALEASLNQVDVIVPLPDDFHTEQSLTCVQVGLAPLKNLSR